MPTNAGLDPRKFVAALHRSRLTIYDPITIGDPALWIPTPELQILLDRSLRGISVAGLPVRTRSKLVKQKVCEALGYPVPKSFKRTRPRFPGQRFDIYAQGRNNLQVWNEELAPARRYVLVGITGGLISCVKVVTGDRLALLDKTGTLTKKYQALCIPRQPPGELITGKDTINLVPFVKANVDLARVATPVNHPRAGELLSIGALFRRLSPLVGRGFADAGTDQRNRGAALHRLVCKTLGYAGYQDNGQFPDVRHQLLEVKLQTSSTIDLGLVRPDSTEALDVPMISGRQVRHCDVRYAVFYGVTRDGRVTLSHLFLTTGEAFFSRFPQCQGKVLNAKLQIRLPADFFDA